MVIRIIRVVDYYVGIPTCFVIGILDKFLNVFRKSVVTTNPEKILLVKTWGIGNIILMLPAMKAVREKYPEAQIYFFSLKNNREILEGNPYINDCFMLDMDGLRAFITSVAENIRLLRGEGIDCILDFDQFARFTALLSFVIGIGKRRIGFNTRGQGKKYVFTDLVDYNNTQHMSKTFYDLAKVIGVAEENYQSVKVPYAGDDLFFVNGFLKTHGIDTQKDILIGIHIGCGPNFPSRRWSCEKYAQLADRLIEEFNVKIYFTGTRSETELVQNTISFMNNKAVDASGRLTIKQMAVIIEKSDIFFSSDTGPLHIASAMDTTVVGFFGPNTPLLYGPLGDKNIIYYKGLPCSPCITNYNAKKSDCRDPICITSIEVDKVYDDVAKRILSENLKR